ncbi:MMPL family transporter [Mobilicoccus caccae]|uniref:Membrane protein n=1 Tax=Mobilicoccus caccae TaxID=1859295 RepID=A0ABQ6IX33_9MICO|nr:MMPL family transporter [Mobilicoccus caccae]GMA42064.1 putative membrane protein [Mobilicoccus caccae]
MTSDTSHVAAGPPEPTGGPWRAHARVTYALRWPIIAFWIALAALAVSFPPPAVAGASGAGSLMSADGEAFKTEVREMEVFGFPLFSRTVVVQRDETGLSPYVQAESVLDAVAVNQREPRPPLLGALPMPNAVTFGAGQDERGTTVLTYLFMDPRTDFGTQHTESRVYAQQNLERQEDHVIGVAGSIPARAQQAYILGLHLPTLELLTLVAIFVIVAAAFRSVVVPFIALGASGIALVITMWVVTMLADLLGVSAPAELQPVLLALLLGVVTDYTIFYVTGLGTAFGRGTKDRRGAVTSAVTTYTPIIVAAGVTVAAATLSLVVARSAFYRPFGPAMAVTILVGLFVAITLVPAIVAVLGRGVFWPRRRAGIASMAQPSRWMAAMVSGLSRKTPAVAALVVSAVVLTIMALPMAGMILKAGFTSSLPDDNTVKRAAVAAAEGFSPGITSPTSVLVHGPGITDDLDGLIDLQDRVAEQPGVAGVVGPALSMPQFDLGVFTNDEHDTARMLVVLKDAPLDGTAVQTLSRLRETLPDLAADSGLQVEHIGVGGDTALAADIIDGTLDDLGRLALAGLAVNLLILIVFLRAVVAPLYLLACNVLSVAAALGLTTFVFTNLLGEDGITFYVPFASAVLLVALGSDYNIFGVGRTWEEARHHPLPKAMAIAMPESSKAITTAGVVLAVSFGMLATVPLSAFRELAFTMAVGILLDVFVVRTFMVPALLTLVGQKSAWPRKSLRAVPDRSIDAPTPASV